MENEELLTLAGRLNLPEAVLVPLAAAKALPEGLLVGQLAEPRNSGCGLPNRGAILPGWHSSGYKPLDEPPEHTSLQRAVKAHLAAGGRLGMARGIPTHKAITKNQGAMG